MKTPHLAFALPRLAARGRFNEERNRFLANARERAVRLVERLYIVIKSIDLAIPSSQILPGERRF